ncbi:hypothetical protein Vretimale_3830 [Volvox reticuliferus]|uniref:Uncharacterized protein n=1 Tax=Volvox reticuliferus TaxID=1737510 RepID=A0A8J4BW09_9CHLO|nr:hypothetical protein Vretifemale_1442 [Volvox reticuliferus]GIL98456.1 hypothetical protein Vretimale_3830 [Volvox reticuliferus]
MPSLTDEITAKLKELRDNAHTQWRAAHEYLMKDGPENATLRNVYAVQEAMKVRSTAERLLQDFCITSDPKELLANLYKARDDNEYDRSHKFSGTDFNVGYAQYICDTTENWYRSLISLLENSNLEPDVADEGGMAKLYLVFGTDGCGQQGSYTETVTVYDGIDSKKTLTDVVTEKIVKKATALGEALVLDKEDEHIINQVNTYHMAKYTSTTETLTIDDLSKPSYYFRMCVRVPMINAPTVTVWGSSSYASSKNLIANQQQQQQQQVAAC